MEFLFGIEHETALIRPDGKFADHTNTSFAELQEIIDALPLFENDYPGLRKGKGEFEGKRIREKRWYVEGFERYTEDGAISSYLVKGIETRTPPQTSIAAAVQELSGSLDILYKELHKKGWHAAWISYHPFLKEISPEGGYTSYEENIFQRSPDMRTGLSTVLSFGPDINISLKEAPESWSVDLVKKLTYYSPFLIPFTASSPFAEGKLWPGISYRTFQRTGRRMAALAFVNDPSLYTPSDPPFVRQARNENEAGRVEMKSFDSIQKAEDYAPLLALLKGIALDTTLPERADTPDQKLHQKAAQQGFTQEILTGATSILEAAKKALEGDPDAELLIPLEQMLQKKYSPATRIITAYNETGDILKTLKLLSPCDEH